MNALHFVAGMLIGIAVCAVSSLLFIHFGTDYAYWDGIRFISQAQMLGQLITICSVLNIAVFFILLRFNKIFMARGIIAALILLAITTILV